MASDLGLQCLPKTLLGVSRLQWINKYCHGKLRYIIKIIFFNKLLEVYPWNKILKSYDSRIAMFYKIVYGLVAIPVPPYFERTMVQTRHHPLAYRQIHTSVSYYYYSFFLMTVILWNRLPADLVLDSDLDSFKSFRSQQDQPYTPLRHILFLSCF